MGVEKINQVYRCEVCGNIIEVLEVGGGTLVCCGKPMILLVEKEKDAGMEKHVPINEKTERGIKIRVGSAEHPMEEKHYIQWIEVISDEKAYKQFLNNTCFNRMKENVIRFCIRKSSGSLLNQAACQKRL